MTIPQDDRMQRNSCMTCELIEHRNYCHSHTQRARGNAEAVLVAGFSIAVLCDSSRHVFRLTAEGAIHCCALLRRIGSAVPLAMQPVRSREHSTCLDGVFALVDHEP